MDLFQEISDKVKISQHHTRFSDGDPAGIVYFSNYPMFFDEAFIQIARQHGFDWGQRDMQFIIPIVEQKVSYKKPLTVGQDYYIATGITHVGNRSFRTSHVLYQETSQGYALGAHGYISRAVVDSETFSAMKMPTNLEKALTKYAVDESEWNKVLTLFEK